MNATSFAHFRKPLALVVSALFVQLAYWAGFDAKELGPDGPWVTEAVNLIIMYGIPAVFMIAQPNRIGESIVKYWRWIVGGLAVLMILIAVLVVLS